MSTMLRSLKYLRRLNVGNSGRRLGSSLHQIPNESLSRAISWTRCSANVLSSRNYVTGIATQQSINADLEYKRSQDVDSILNEIDRKIKHTGSIYREDVEEVIDAVLRKGTLTSIQALLLIRCCGNFLSSESLAVRKYLVKNVWELINDSDIQLDVSHYNSLLLVNLENESDFSPLDVLVEMKDKNIDPNRVTFQRLIEQYCEKGDIQGATKILEHMSKNEIPINETIFNSLIKGHSMAGDATSAVNIPNIMKQSGIEPSSRTYSALLCVHARKGDIEAIRKVMDECKQKDILFSDKEVLEVIYTLAVNEHHDLLDELINVLPKGSTFNKDIIITIYKLIEKNQIEMAYKLFKNMKKPARSIEEDDPHQGRFFIKKLVTTNVDTETVKKYCKKMLEEKLNVTSFETAIQAAFKNKMHHMAIPLLKAHKESGGEIRELFFYPIFVSFGKSNNLQGILNTLKSMTFDFEMKPSIYVLKEYVIPYMVEDDVTNVITLVNLNLQFSTVINAVIFYLLEEGKTKRAAKLINATNLTFRTNLLVRPLVYAFLKNKDIKSFINIVQFQYMKLLENNSNINNGSGDENSEDQITATQFIDTVLQKIINQLPNHSSEVLINVLNGFLDKGMSLEKETVKKVEAFLGSQNLKPETASVLNQLSSGELIPESLNKNKDQVNAFERLNKKIKLNRQLDENIEITPELKMMLIAQHARNFNHDEVEKLIKELAESGSNYTLGFCASLVDYYSRIEKIDEADKWFKQMAEIDPQNKMDMSKIINYSVALVKANRVQDALKILNHPVLDQDSDRNVLCQKLMKTVSTYCPDQLEEFFNILKNNKFFKIVTSSLVRSIIQVPLTEGNIEKAMEKFQWACENFNVTPYKMNLMKELIKNEDANNLQRVTDLSTKVHGEMSALYDLAIAFLESDRMRQARKILETPGVYLRKSNVLNTALRYKEQNELEKFENMIQLLTGLYLELNPLYIMLLQAYDQTGDWQKCLSLWTQMQEDNIQPSTEFMNELEKILVNNGQEVPFARSLKHRPISESSSKINGFTTALVSENFEEAEKILNQIPSTEKNKCLLQLAEIYLQNNKFEEAKAKIELIKNEPLDPNIDDTIKNILTKLVEQDEFSTIYQIITKVIKDSKNGKNVLACRILNDKYYETDNYGKLISHMEKILDDPNKKNTVINSFFHTSVAAIASYKNSQVEEKLEKFAPRALEGGLSSPINAYWLNKFIQDSPQAEEIYNKYLSSTARFQSLSAVTVIKDLGLYEKLPQLTEIFIEHKHLNFDVKRKTLSAIITVLLNSEEPKKYDLAYECVRLAAKVVPPTRLNQSRISEIEKNLTDGKTLQSLSEESERKKATG